MTVPRRANRLLALACVALLAAGACRADHHENPCAAGKDKGDSVIQAIDAFIEKKVVDGPGIIITVPEPATIVLVGIGLVAMRLASRRPRSH